MAKTRQYDDETLFAFSTQLSLMYESGIGLEDGLSLLKSQNKVLPMDALIEGVKRTGRLSRTLKEDPGFPATFVQALGVAEEVGKEDKVVRHLARYYQRQAESKQFLRDILFMPLILLSILIVVMGVLSYAVLPIFQEVYTNLGGSNPIWVQALLKVVQIISLIGLGVLILALGFIGLKALQHRLDPDRHEPVIETLLRFFPQSKAKADLARFTFIAQLLLEGGVDNRQALGMAQNQLLAGKLLTRIKNVGEGLGPTEGLYELLLKAEIYPPLLQNTLNLAAKAGKLDAAMDILSEKVQIEAENSLNETLNRIEPILVVILTVFVSTVLFSLIIPLLGVMSVIGA